VHRKLAIAAAAVAALLATTAGAGAAPTTEDETITGDAAAAYSDLSAGPGQARLVREDVAAAVSGRDTRRTSLAYFGQLTDFQLSDEESPARVEFLDVTGSPTNAAQRPQEALLAFMVDQGIRALNRFTTSPVSSAAMDFDLVTGDQADSMQRNEVRWVVELLEGGPVHPNSGVERPCSGRPGEAAKYTGVQDYDDYYESGDHYDPDDPRGRYGAWPAYPGLMDRAQQPFHAAGTAVPSYVTFGNHDGLVQGNAWATAGYEAIATGCAKVFAPVPLNQQVDLLNGTTSSPENVFRVPPDRDRQYVDRAQYRALHDDAASNGHGFGYVSVAEDAASRGSASYYTFEPKPGLQLVAIDTVSNGGTVGDSAEGNVDDPQWRWLDAVLDANEAEPVSTRDLVVVYAHHPVRSLVSRTPDEMAPPCGFVSNQYGHDPNPGCDKDPRVSIPVHQGADLVTELLDHPQVISYVAGHTHDNKLTPFARTTGPAGGFWEITTSALADWPIQSRLIEVMDNHDGTLSIFGTLVDHLGPVTAPAPGPAGALDKKDLASLGRTFAFNDEQAGGGTGEGTPSDRNAELLLPDPR
jgi:metallophosphoesterase (TIGR03767 family)